LPWRTVWLLVVLLVLTVVGYALLKPRGISVTTVLATHKAIRSEIACSGVLQPPPTGEVHATDGGTVREIAVADGARVKKGGLLLRLDNPSLAAEALEAREKLLETKTAAEAATTELTRAEGEAHTRRSRFESDSRLLARGALTRAAYDADLLALQAADAALGAAQASSRSLGDEAGSRMAIARERSGDLDRRVEGLLIRAPMGGVVYGLPRRVGETLSPGQVAANVTDPDHPIVRARLDEPDLPRVRVGEPLLVSFDGLPGERWAGQVTTASPELFELGNRRVGEARGTLDDPAHHLPLNASVNVAIVVGEKPSTLVVPRAALHGDGARRFVYVLRADRADRVETTVGLVGTTDAEILDGLSEGERVILSGGASLSPGARVVVSGP
jgi:RND family efflux transporter MFP subunit